MTKSDLISGGFALLISIAVGLVLAACDGSDEPRPAQSKEPVKGACTFADGYGSGKGQMLSCSTPTSCVYCYERIRDVVCFPFNPAQCSSVGQYDQ